MSARFRPWTIVAYPVLAAAYPVIALYAVNLREMIPLQQTVAPLVGALVIGLLALVGSRRWLGDWHRAGLLTTALIILFFSYGTVWDHVRDLVVGHVTLLATWSVLALLVGLLVRRLRRDAAEATTPALNLIAVALVVGNVVAIGQFQLAVEADTPARTPPPLGTAPIVVDELPDIYWIVLDRYGSQQVVKEYYGHDISPFIEALRDRGFYVAEHATANYLKTAPSLVSARDMAYLDGQLLRERASADDDWGPLYRDLSRSFSVLEVLSSLDYRFVYLGTYWAFTASHPEADVNYVYAEARSEFARALSDRTMLRALEGLGGAQVTDWRRERWNLTRFQWDRLADSISLGGPKLVHAHFALPHDPYVFQADGGFVSEEAERERSTGENYAEQVEYANAAVLDFVDELLAAEPDNAPVVILQSEEGPWPHRYRMSESTFGWAEDATDEELHEKFGILSAFHVPGFPGEHAEEVGFYPSISLVNQFRVIFNHYLGTAYDVLPDRNFIWPRQDNIYEFIDVTDRVRRMVERPGSSSLQRAGTVGATTAEAPS